VLVLNTTHVRHWDMLNSRSVHAS